jgi:hypothetical protein
MNDMHKCSYRRPDILRIEQQRHPLKRWEVQITLHKTMQRNLANFSRLKHVLRNVKPREEEHADHTNEKEQKLFLFHRPEQRMRVVPQQK